MADRRHDREIVRLALPALVTLLAEPAYLLVDTAVVGHLGTPQLGGLAVASAILLTSYSLCIFLAYGTTAAVARLLGAGDRSGAAAQAVQGLWLGAGVGVGLAIVLAGAVAVVDDARRVVGLFTDGDLRRYLAGGATDVQTRPVVDLMTKNPSSVRAGRLAADALAIFQKHRFDDLVVLNADGTLVQSGTIHAWHNPFDKLSSFLAVVFGARNNIMIKKELL